jgi:hypothetical protein
LQRDPFQKLADQPNSSHEPSLEDNTYFSTPVEAEFPYKRRHSQLEYRPIIIILSSLRSELHISSSHNALCSVLLHSFGPELLLLLILPDLWVTLES